MEEYPIEILHSVFITLPLEDRIKCMFVCRKWYNILDQHSLLYDIDMKSRRQYLGFMKMIEYLPYRATQVEKLKLRHCFSPDFDKRMLFNVFPNVREIILKGYCPNEPKPNYNDEYYFTHQASKLQKIEDLGAFELTLQLANSNLCGQLKTLRLDFVKRSHSTFVITQLKNMPTLEMLSLHQIQLNITNFEMMHNNLPSIKYLNIKYGDLVPSRMPSDIKPAALLKKLSLCVTLSKDSFTHAQWYRYMSRKYPNINDFDYDDTSLVEGDQDHIEFVFENGFIYFLKTICPRLEDYSFTHFYHYTDAFKNLDDFGCKLKKLKIKASDNEVLFSEALARSNQAKYIQKLFLKDIDLDPTDQLKNMTALEVLNIDHNGYVWYHDGRDKPVIYLNQLIEACPPNLTTLTVYCADIQVNSITSSLTHITNLELRFVNLTQDLATVISAHFPKLLNLNLYGETETELVISLPSNNLHDVSIGTITEHQHGFSIETKNDNKTLYQDLRPVKEYNLWGEAYTVDRLVFLSKEELCETIGLKFICASVKNIKFFTSKLPKFA